MTLAERVDVYKGLAETTGNDNRDVPFYPGYLWPDAIFDRDVNPPHIPESFRLLGGIIVEEALKRAPHPFGRRLCPLVLEFGCGPGHLVHYVYQHADYIGIDGNPDFLRFNRYLDPHKHCFLMLDLTKPIRIVNANGPVKAEVVCSFEVFEHLYPKDVDTMLESVVHHMKEDAIFFCTASNKHRRSMDVHLTVESRTWWLATFRKHGLVEVDGMAERIMDRHPYNWRHDSTHAFALRRKDV